MTLAILLNMGFAGGTAGADPPTAFPLKLVLAEANRFNQAVPRNSANNPDVAVSKNDIEL